MPSLSGATVQKEGGSDHERRHSCERLWRGDLYGKDSKVIKQACPWSVPNWSKDQKQMVKCTMCRDRVDAGLLPACVKACPTGALNFGEEADIKKLTKERLAEANKKFGAKAHIEDEKDVRALFLIVDDFIKYKPMEL
jgi:formate dehydrogenase iron-sulfur subunit